MVDGCFVQVPSERFTLVDSRNVPIMNFEDFVFMYSMCERHSLSAMNAFNQGTIDPLVPVRDCFETVYD